VRRDAQFFTLYLDLGYLMVRISTQTQGTDAEASYDGHVSQSLLLSRCHHFQGSIPRVELSPRLNWTCSSFLVTDSAQYCRPVYS
jgi:hypothetical protein